MPKDLEKLPGWFPARNQMVDTGEIFIAQTAEEIPHTRGFKVLETRVKAQKDDRSE